MLARLFAVLLLAPLLLPLATAAPDPTAPGVSEWVEGSFTLAQPSLTRIELTGDLLVHKHPIGSRVYTATMMSRQYQGITDFDEGAGEAFVQRMEEAVREALSGSLAASFPAATRTVTTVDVDEDTLLASRRDAHEPPIRVRVAATVERTRESMGLAGVEDAGVAAVLAAGGRIQSDLALVADPGHDLTFVIEAPRAPEGVAFSQLSTGVVSGDGATVAVSVGNTRGARPLARDVALHLVEPGASSPAQESIATVVDVTMGALEAGAGQVPLEARVQAALRAISVADRFPGALPPSVHLDFVSADGLRALRQAGVVTDADLDAADAAFRQTIAADLAAALGAEAAASGGIDRDDLARATSRPYDGDPPVLFEAAVAGAYAVAGDHAEHADLALSIGASIRLDLSLTSGSGEATYRLHPPPRAQFFDPRGATVTADGLTATVVVPPGEARQVGLSLRRADAPRYEAEQATLGIVVDLHDIDVTVGQAVSGDFGTLLADVKVRGELAVVSVPESVKAALGDSLDLAFVDSEAIRRLLDRGLLTQARLAELEATLLDEVRRNVADALGSNVVVTGGFDAATLAPGAGVPTPIVFQAQASFARPLSAPTQAAIALYSVPQSFTFPRVRDLETTYTVVLPRGLAVTSLDATGGESETRTWSDGREAFTVRPTGDAAQTSVTMSVTPTFVMLKFWPLVLGALVVLVLLVGTPIALVVLRRRKA